MKKKRTTTKLSNINSNNNNNSADPGGGDHGGGGGGIEDKINRNKLKLTTAYGTFSKKKQQKCRVLMASYYFLMVLAKPTLSRHISKETLVVSIHAKISCIL